MNKALHIAGGIVAGLGSWGWAGLRVRPAPFAAPGQSATPDTIALPASLPAPVARFYRQTYGEQVPVIRSAVLSGRGRLRLSVINFPMRFRFIYEARRHFRSYFELTIFGAPVMRVNEHFVNGKFRQELPFGVEAGKPKIDHSAALRMWAEWVTWLPAMLLTDPQVRWEPLDATMALLVVPVGNEQERLVVRFDEATGKLQYVEAMKYKQSTDTTKTLWVNAVWFGERPWATFNVEQMVYNVPVDTSLAAKGP
ncbi:MAG: hypothetical protein MUD01_13815 [Chloroflexaceae bacterium]|jgi:hypothetical protein|nr:hypothetical protein [Chloroflexaceae bacterium]